MKRFKRFLEENRRFVGNDSYEAILEEVEREMDDIDMKVEDGKSDTFVVMHHSDDDDDMEQYMEESICESEYYADHLDGGNKILEKEWSEGEETDGVKRSKLVNHG